MSGLRHLGLLVRLLVEDRQRLVLENVALRHQLAVLKRSVTRPKLRDILDAITSSARVSAPPAR